MRDQADLLEFLITWALVLAGGALVSWVVQKAISPLILAAALSSIVGTTLVTAAFFWLAGYSPWMWMAAFVFALVFFMESFVVGARMGKRA